MKAWRNNEDRVLANLSSRLLDRNLFRIELKSEPFTEKEISNKLGEVQNAWALSLEDAEYFVSSGMVENQPYKEHGIFIKTKSGEIVDFAKANDNLTIESLSRNVQKYFLCYPKDLN